MALPKFTTTPTPLYQQQPIIKRPNYSEIYLRNFAAAEASMTNSFGKIADRLDKIALEKEKKKEQEIKENREEYEDNKDLDDKIRYAVRSLNTQNRAKAIDMFSQQADGIRDAKQSAKDDETGEGYKTLRVIEKKFFDNIGTFVGAFENIEKHRNYSQTNDMDAIYSGYQRDPKQNAFRNEVISNNGYDLTFGLDEALDIELQYKDDATGELVYMSMEDVAAMDLDNWGQKQTNWDDDEAHENQQFTALYDSIGSGTASEFLFNAHNSLAEKTIVNQQSAIDENGNVIPGVYDTSTMVVKKHPDIYKKGIENYVYGNLNSSLNAEQKAKIFHDKIVTSGIENEADDIAKEMISLSGGKYTENDYDDLRLAVLTYGPNKINNEDLKDNPIYTEVHEFINTKAVTWATNRFWHTKYGQHEDIPPKPDVKRDIKMDEVTAKPNKKINFLENMNGTMETIGKLRDLSLGKNQYSEIQSILNGLGDTYKVKQLTNYQSGAQIDAAAYNKLLIKYIEEDGMTEDDAITKAEEKTGKIVGKEGGFVYTDKTQEWEIYQMIMKANDYDLSDKEARDLYTSWVIEEKQHGGNAFLRKFNGLKEDHWSNWLLNEKVTWKKNIQKIYGDRDKYYSQFLNPEQD
jgi:hypothetical protein